MKKIALYFFVWLFFSCGKEGIKDNSGRLVSYKDSVFLEIEGNLHDPAIIWPAKDVWIQALTRLERHSWISDSLLVWNVKEGRQLNMGENVFCFIIGTWERMNAKVKTGRYEYRHVEGNRYFPQLKENVYDCKK